MTFLLCLLLACAFYAVSRWRSHLIITNDGEHYLRLGITGTACAPYQRRWLLPALLKGNIRAWTLTTQISLILTGALVGVYAGWDLTTSLVATALFCSLCAVWSQNASMRVLTDSPMLALALLSALTSLKGYTELAVLLALIAGAVKEPGPILAACFARDPALLVGLLSVNWFFCKTTPPANEPWLAESIKWARGARDPWDFEKLFLSWGALSILFALGLENAPLGLVLGAGAALLVSHAQLLVAIDTARLTQLAAPAVIATALYAPWWAVVLGVLTNGFISHMCKDV